MFHWRPTQSGSKSSGADEVTHMRSVAHRIDRGTPPKSIRLLIAETQRLIRQSLRLLLEQEHDVASVIEATDGHEAYRLALKHKPDIVLLDVDLPDLDVESVATHIHHHLPNTRVLLLVRYDEDSRIVAAMQAGAFGYILKDTDRTDFLCTIRAATHGKQVFSPTIPNHVIQASTGKPPHAEHGAVLASLTDREQEILACAAAGRSNKEIADKLCVSVETIKTHLHHIYQKLSVGGRVEAIVTYLQTQ